MLSIVIPTLNEEKSLARCIAYIRKRASDPDLIEIVVSDSGSLDQTCEIASSLECFLVRNQSPETSKAQALNSGAHFASGEVLLFLDADTELPPSFDLLIGQTLADARVIGGAFEFALDSRGFSLRVIEMINRLRYRLVPNYFGDQAIFVRTADFEAVGGFPAKRLMEGSKLCQVLRKRGQLRLQKERVVTSSRRFQQGGVWNVLLNDAKIWGLDLLGMEVDKYATSYWQENVNRGRRPKV